MRMNTKIRYLYRDSGNYKVYQEAVVSGTLTEEEQKTILSCLDSGEYFVPSAVGLPEERFETFDPDEDHPWFEFDEPPFSSVWDSPTVDVSSKKLVKAFKKYKGQWHKAFSTDHM